MIPVHAFKGKTVAIFGLGRSGMSAARALKAGGAYVTLWDDAPKNLLIATREGFTIENLRQSNWQEFDALILSPGVPLTHPSPHWTVDCAHAANVPVIGDIECFAQTLAQLPNGERAKTIAITGTNGKSTTTALIGHIVKACGPNTHVGGNIGIGILDLPDELYAGSVYVIETSSYQLDLCQSFAPDVALLMNITPDHLDRHGGMEGYVAAKMRIFAHQTQDQTAIVGVDDDYGVRIVSELRQRNKAKTISISSRQTLSRGIYAVDGVLFDAVSGPARKLIDLKNVSTLTGRHNWQNAAAAYAACTSIGLPSDAILSAMKTFGGLDHRMQEIAKIGKVRFINDSKATNADAARQAMSSFPNFYWIAGGKAKEGGISSLTDLFSRIKQAFLIGEASDDFAHVLKDNASLQPIISHHLLTAVAQAYAEAEKSGEEEIVLFSPACASFDQFSDFEARGDAFKAAVFEIKAHIEADA